jgi:hypothetical protein
MESGEALTQTIGNYNHEGLYALHQGLPTQQMQALNPTPLSKQQQMQAYNPIPLSLRDRLKMQLRDAMKEVARLEELLKLMDANPDAERIMELLRGAVL